MARQAKQTQIWTVRNAQGQFLATYRAYTGQQAIARLHSDQAAYASVFRTHTMNRPTGLTATVENIEPKE